MLFKHLPQNQPLGTEYWRQPVNVDLANHEINVAVPGVADFKLLAESIPALCWMARGDGYIFWYNQRWHDYCGTTPVAMEGWGWMDVHHPDQLSRVMDEWQKCIASGEPFEMIFPIRGADGVFRRFLTRIVPVRSDNGIVVRWLGSNTEVESQLNAEAALEFSEAKLRVLTDVMPQMVWSTLPDGYHDYYNARWYEFTGVHQGATDGEGWNEMLHPEDQPIAFARWRQSLDTGEPYEVEYRLRRHDGHYRWTLGRALPVRDAEGRITRWIGTCTDIDDARKASEQSELLSHELSHRIKNIFAVIGGLIGLSAPTNPEAKTFAKELSGRIAALGRAHSFARSHSPLSKPEASFSGLHGLLTELMLPYQGHEENPYSVTGDDNAISERSATPLSLVIHEMATNAVKYGALSTTDGHIAIHTALIDDEMVIQWREERGPMVSNEAREPGFGTLLSQASIVGQLGGRIERKWNPSGLEVTMTIPRDHL